MANIIVARIEQRRVVADVPEDWPDGTEVDVHLVCRPGLTAKDDARTVDEMIVINNLRDAEKQGVNGDES